MPSRTLLLCAVLGLVIISGIVGFGLFVSRGTHLELRGSSQKTRIVAVNPSKTVIVMDFRITNPADYPFKINTAEMELTTAEGKKVVGQFIPDVDAKQVFLAFPSLGDKYNPSIGFRQTIAPHATLDLMLASVFELNEAAVQARKDLLIRFEDVDGPKSEIR